MFTCFCLHTKSKLRNTLVICTCAVPLLTMRQHVSCRLAEPPTCHTQSPSHEHHALVHLLTNHDSILNVAHRLLTGSN